MENPAGGSAPGMGPQNEPEPFGMAFRGVGGMEAYCDNLPPSSSSSVPGLLRLSQTAAGCSGVSVPTYSDMHPAETHPLNISDVQPLRQQADPGQHGDVMRRMPHPALFSDVRHGELTTSDDDGSISGKFTVPQSSSSPSEGHSSIGLSPASQSAKKTKGRVKIKMEYIDNKLRRYTTFSKRKTGIMKKAYELSTLTGTQVMLLVASETGHVYTFATRKLQPMITSEAGKALIQTCLNSPDPAGATGGDQRMSATGFEETELCCSPEDELKEGDSDCESSRSGGGRDSALGGGREAAAPAPAPAAAVTSAFTAPATALDWTASQAAHLHQPLLPAAEGLVLLNNPTSVIRRVASEHAGEPPAASEPTDLSKSRVTLIGAPADGPPGRT